MKLKEFLEEKIKTTKHTCLTQHLMIYQKEQQEIIKQTNYLPNNCKFTERIYHIINDLKEKPKCKCRKECSFRSLKYGYSSFCSDQCWRISLTNEEKNRINKKAKETKLKKYGCFFNNREKAKKTCQNKYGVDFIFQENSIKNKIRKIKLEKYGNEYYTNSEAKKNTWNKKGNEEKIVINRKKKETLFKNYPNFYRERSQKRKEIFLEYLNASKRLNGIVKPKIYKGFNSKNTWICQKCNIEFEDNLKMGKIPRCPNCYPIKSRPTSIIECEIFYFLEKFFPDILKNKRFEKKFELDIFIPSKNIGIELNGLYWHSELNGKDKNYHSDKTKFFEERGIQVIHIFEDEWIEKQEIVKSIILSKLGLIENKIFARKTMIKEIFSADAKLFLFDNHIQGEVNSKVNLGLFYNDELVSLMTFSKPRFNKHYDWEMVRFCNKINTNVIGGAGKLLVYFRKNYSGSIISYADRRFSQGKIYETLEFKGKKQSAPDYFYFKNGYNRYSRVQFQKHKLKDKLEIFDPNLTEWQNMQLNGYDRIWDCGNLVFELN